MKRGSLRISSYLCCCRLQLCLFFFFSHIVEALWLNELFFNEAALYPRRRCSSPVVLRENLANACLAHGTFSLLLATTPKRVLFTSRQARPSHPQHLSLPCLFLFLPALHLAAAQREAGRSVRDTVSLTLLSSPLLATTSLSLRCPGETVIDEALSLSLVRGILSFHPPFLLSSAFSSVSLAIWKPADVGLTFPTAEIHLA